VFEEHDGEIVGEIVYAASTLGYINVHLIRAERSNPKRVTGRAMLTWLEAAYGFPLRADQVYGASEFWDQMKLEGLILSTSSEEQLKTVGAMPPLGKGFGPTV
jgi:hypothetical protein